jgi:hypothetical protein
VKSLIVGLAVVVAAQVASAQANPKLAYAKTIAGKGRTPASRSVYVANADGSNEVSVYSTSALIGDVELSPNHDKIFIIDDKSLRVLSLSVSGASVSVSGSLMIDSGLSADGVAVMADWSADGNSILYMNHKNGISKFKIVSALDGSLGASHTLTSLNVGNPKFVGANKIAYVDYSYVYNQPSVRLMQLNLDGSLASDSEIYHGSVETIEAARLSETVIISAGTQIKALDVNSQAVSLIYSNAAGVQDACMNADDSAVYFRSIVSSKRSSSYAIMKRDMVSGLVSTIKSSADQLRNLDAE